jgi:hypothetical protein
MLAAIAASSSTKSTRMGTSGVRPVSRTGGALVNQNYQN